MENTLDQTPTASREPVSDLEGALVEKLQSVTSSYAAVERGRSSGGSGLLRAAQIQQMIDELPATARELAEANGGVVESGSVPSARYFEQAALQGLESVLYDLGGRYEQRYDGITPQIPHLSTTALVGSLRSIEGVESLAQDIASARQAAAAQGKEAWVGRWIRELSGEDPYAREQASFAGLEQFRKGPQDE